LVDWKARNKVDVKVSEEVAEKDSISVEWLVNLMVDLLDLKKEHELA
jgi:hypothetical protein